MPSRSPLRPIFASGVRHGSVHVGAQIGLARDANISAAAVTASATVITPTVTAGTGVDVGALVVTATVSVPAATASAPTDVSISASVFTVAAETLSPSVAADSAAPEDGDLFDDIGVAFDDPDFS